MSRLSDLQTLLALLATLVMPPAEAKSTAFDQAIASIRARDCEALGEIVNRGIEDRAPDLLYVAGLMHDEGLCVDADPVRARMYFDAGAQQGDREAAVALGLHYALADGLPRSYGRAGAWLLHAKALELRSLEGRSVDEFDRHRMEALRESVLAGPYLHAVPPMPADGDNLAEWLGYLSSVHFLGSRLIDYPKRALHAGAEGAFRLRVCPHTNQVEVRHAPRASGLPSTTSGAALHALRQEVVRAYRNAQRLLPRPLAIPDPASCMETVIVFRLQ